VSAAAIEARSERSDWATKPLGEICKFTGGGTPSKKRADFWSGDIPWVSPKDMKSEVITTSMDKISIKGVEGSAAKLIPENSILIVVRSGILARTVPTAIAGRELTVNQDLKALLPSDRIAPRFLAYFLRAVEPVLLRSVTKGATVHRLSTDTLKTLPIPLPPMDEQKRIVAVLDQAFAALDRARTNAEANLADAEELFGGAVDAVIHRLANGREKSLRLGSIVTRLTNGYVGPTRDIYIDDGVPYLLARHVRDNHLQFDGKTFVSDEFNEKHKKSKLKVDDVLLVQSGHIGHSAVVPPDHDGHNCHAMIVLTTIKETLSGEYLSAVFNTPGMQKRFQDIRTGSTVPHLTCKMVKELMISVPPLAVQGEVLSEIRRLRLHSAKLKNRYESEISDLTDLRQSILQKAFAGELT